MTARRITKATLFEVVPAILIALLELVKIRVFKTCLGDATNGYYQLINNVLGYLFLVEAGLNSAVIFKMFKPVAGGDTQGLNAVYSGSVVIFRRIGAVMLAVLAALCLAMPAIVGLGGRELMEILAAFLTMGFACIASFVMVSRPLVCVFHAHEDKHIANLIALGIRAGQAVAAMAAAAWLRSILAVAGVMLFFKLAEEGVFLLVARKRYPFLKRTARRDTSAAAMTGDLILHQVGSLSANNVDTVVLQILSGPVMVSVYGCHNYIHRFLTELVMRFTGTVANHLGIRLHKENSESVYRFFKEYLLVCFLIALLVCACFLCGARAFINVWMSDGKYVLPYKTVALFASALFLQIIYYPLTSLTSVRGLFKQTRYYPLIAAGINLGLSVGLGAALGIDGVLFATTISLLVAVCLRLKSVCRHVFKNAPFWRLLGQYALRFGAFLCLCLCLAPAEEYIFARAVGYASWAGHMGLVALGAGGVCLAGWFLLKRAFARGGGKDA